MLTVTPVTYPEIGEQIGRSEIGPSDILLTDQAVVVTGGAGTSSSSW